MIRNNCCQFFRWNESKILYWGTLTPFNLKFAFPEPLIKAPKNVPFNKGWLAVRLAIVPKIVISLSLLLLWSRRYGCSCYYWRPCPHLPDLNRKWMRKILNLGTTASLTTRQPLKNYVLLPLKSKPYCLFIFDILVNHPRREVSKIDYEAVDHKSSIPRICIFKIIWTSKISQNGTINLHSSANMYFSSWQMGVIKTVLPQFSTRPKK